LRTGAEASERQWRFLCCRRSGFADAILDRLVHNAYRLALDGPSMRDPKMAKPDTAALATDAADAMATTIAKPAKGVKK
jgi:hypothetical protein